MATVDHGFTISPDEFLTLGGDKKIKGPVSVLISPSATGNPVANIFHEETTGEFFFKIFFILQLITAFFIVIAFFFNMTLVCLYGYIMPTILATDSTFKALSLSACIFVTFVVPITYIMAYISTVGVNVIEDCWVGFPFFRLLCKQKCLDSNLFEIVAIALLFVCPVLAFLIKYFQSHGDIHESIFTAGETSFIGAVVFVSCCTALVICCDFAYFVEIKKEHFPSNSLWSPYPWVGNAASNPPVVNTMTSFFDIKALQDSENAELDNPSQHHKSSWAIANVFHCIPFRGPLSTWNEYLHGGISAVVIVVLAFATFILPVTFYFHSDDGTNKNLIIALISAWALCVVVFLYFALVHGTDNGYHNFTQLHELVKERKLILKWVLVISVAFIIMLYLFAIHLTAIAAVAVVVVFLVITIAIFSVFEMDICPHFPNLAWDKHKYAHYSVSVILLRGVYVIAFLASILSLIIFRNSASLVVVGIFLTAANCFLQVYSPYHIKAISTSHPTEPEKEVLVSLEDFLLETGAWTPDDLTCIFRLRRHRKAVEYFSIFFIMLSTVLVFLGASSLNDNVPFVAAANGTYSFPVPINATTQYPLCQLQFQGLSSLDIAYLTKVAYLDPGDNATTTISEWFDGHIIIDQIPQRRLYKPYYWVLNDTRTGYTIVAIRGTTAVSDWIQNADLWAESAIYQFFQFAIPFFNLWPDDLGRLYIEKLSSWEKFFTPKQTGPADNYPSIFWEEMNDIVAQLVMERDKKVLVVGHSLGGGLAQITAALNGVQGVGVSGPGIVLCLKKLGIDSESKLDFVTNIQPEQDVVPAIDKQAVSVQHIHCPHDPLTCHYVVTTICEIARVCGDPQGRGIITKDDDWCQGNKIQ